MRGGLAALGPALLLLLLRGCRRCWYRLRRQLSLPLLLLPLPRLLLLPLPRLLLLLLLGRIPGLADLRRLLPGSAGLVIAAAKVGLQGQLQCHLQLPLELLLVLLLVAVLLVLVVCRAAAAALVTAILIRVHVDDGQLTHELRRQRRYGCRRAPPAAPSTSARAPGWSSTGAAAAAAAAAPVLWGAAFTELAAVPVPVRGAVAGWASPAPAVLPLLLLLAISKRPSGSAEGSSRASTTTPSSRSTASGNGQGLPLALCPAASIGRRGACGCRVRRNAGHRLRSCHSPCRG